MISISLNIERWKFNKEFGIYVSNKGHFKNRDKKLIAPKVQQSGYLIVPVNNNKYKLAHRLVMLTWRPTQRAEEYTVDHLDHNKRNNAVNNLEWVTRRENQRRAKEDEIIVDEKTEKIKVKDDIDLSKYRIKYDNNFYTVDEYIDTFKRVDSDINSIKGQLKRYIKDKHYNIKLFRKKVEIVNIGRKINNG